jgi:hypothetical protein
MLYTCLSGEPSYRAHSVPSCLMKVLRPFNKGLSFGISVYACKGNTTGIELVRRVQRDGGLPPQYRLHRISMPSGNGSKRTKVAKPILVYVESEVVLQHLREIKSRSSKIYNR